MTNKNCISVYVDDEDLKKISEESKKERVSKSKYLYQMYLKACNIDSISDKLTNMDETQNEIFSLLKKNYVFQKYHFACERFRESVNPSDCELINEFSKMNILKQYD